jgi:hypothetical protein
MRKTLFFLFVLNTLIASSQSDTITDNRFCIKISPLSLIDFTSCYSYRFGVETKLYKNYSLNLECGGYFPNSNGYTNIRGFVAKVEVRMYLNKKSLTQGRYVSLEYFYKNQSFTNTDSIAAKHDYEKSYTLYKYINCGTIKYGNVLLKVKHFVFDYFGGIGIRYKNVHSTLSNVEFANIIKDPDPEGEMVNQLIRQCGKVFLPNFDAGIKIGYHW